MNSSLSSPLMVEGFEVTWIENVKGKILRVVKNRDTLNTLLCELALQGIVPLKVKRVKLHEVNVNECIFRV